MRRGRHCSLSSMSSGTGHTGTRSGRPYDRRSGNASGRTNGRRTRACAGRSYHGGTCCTATGASDNGSGRSAARSWPHDRRFPSRCPGLHHGRTRSAGPSGSYDRRSGRSGTHGRGLYARRSHTRRPYTGRRPVARGNKTGGRRSVRRGRRCDVMRTRRRRCHDNRGGRTGKRRDVP